MIQDWKKTAVTWIALLAVVPCALGVIKALTPLRTIVQESSFICVAKVEALHADKPAMVLSIEEDLKGKAPFRKLPVSLKGGAEADKLKHVPQLLKRLAPEEPLILFVNQANKKLLVFGYTNGTWMQFVGQKTEADAAVLSLTHGEPYLRRTFKGTTVELTAVVKEGLAGKKKLPEPNPNEAPGFGPEVATK